MIGPLQVKVCGLSSLDAAQEAERGGVDYLGFIFYPKSPRYIAREAYQALQGRLPALKKVGVTVEPTREDLQWMLGQGFDRIQIHFRSEGPLATVADWSDLITPERLWLAPKLPPGMPFPTAILPLAETILLDTFQADKFGGTGKTGDWGHFRALQQEHPGKTWILSGGLTAENVQSALKATGARFVDVNSGVESAPGVKDPAKIRAFCAVLRS